MGKKIPYDQALKMASIAPNETIYAKDNPYGFKINVNHPKIRPLYERFKEKVGERILSDSQRRHFELLIFELIERKRTHE
jgi:hypothetical protein